MKSFFLPSLLLTFLLFSLSRAAIGQSSFPPSCVDKAATTPDFYQSDPRGNFANQGKMYCGPVSVSDAFMYLAAHGFDKLLPSGSQGNDQAQIDMINTLATDRYMHTFSEDNTNASSFLWGVGNYVVDHGYQCPQIQYEGPAQLGPRVKKAKVSDTLDLDWIKSAVSNPNGFAWLSIGLYVHGNEPGQWIKTGGHIVVVVGYGTRGDGSLDPNVLIVHNPNRETFEAAANPSDISEDVVTLTPLTDGQLVNNQNGQSIPASGHYVLTGPGLPHPARVDADILDGAFVLVVGQNSAQ